MSSISHSFREDIRVRNLILLRSCIIFGWKTFEPGSYGMCNVIPTQCFTVAFPNLRVDKLEEPFLLWCYVGHRISVVQMIKRTLYWECLRGTHNIYI